MQLDIIGDVHGHADVLEALLCKLGYRHRDGAFRHADRRRVVFVGDLIDRGPHQIRTVAIARDMVEAGTALIVMGNHEFNAIAFATRDPQSPDVHFRPRRGSSLAHHSVFLDAVGGADGPCHRDLVAFFAAMPLWLDLDAVRVVHACWSQAAIEVMAPFVDPCHRLTEKGLLSALTKGTPAHAACEILLKGPEMRLPLGVTYRDAQNSRRKTTRTRWWDADAITLRKACVERSVADQLPDDPVPPESAIVLDESKPVFFGHYWIEGLPRLLAPRRTCLDFSIAKGGVLCAYRFDGEPDLDPANLVWVG